MSLDPTKGAEIRKTRPAVIVSSDHLGILPLKLIVPITEWNDRFAGNSWHVRVSPSPTNGLDKEGALDVLQTRSVDVARFVRKLGFLSADLMEEIAASIALVVEYT